MLRSGRWGQRGGKRGESTVRVGQVETVKEKNPSTAEFIQDNIQKHFWDCNINVKPYTNIFNYKNFNYLCPDRTNGK